MCVLVAMVVAGCGGGGGSSSSSSSELASVASPGSAVFVEGGLKPTGELKSNVDAVANKLAGISNLGDFIVSELESSASKEGANLDFAKEVEPWLGDRGGVAFERLEGDELSEPLIAVETTSPKASQRFIDQRTSEGSKPSKDVTYEGVDFKVGGSEDNALGVIGKMVVLAASEKEFKAAVKAFGDESLADEARFQNAIAAATKGSFADIYIDVGAIVKQSGDQIDAQTREVLQGAGIDPEEATAVASLIPHSDQIEVDLSSALGGEKPPSGDVSQLLGSMPASSFAAIAFAGFGEQLEEAVDELDESGIPPELAPGELKSSLSQAGIDLDKVVGSLEEAAIYAEGSDRDSLSGAMVVTSKSSEAAEAVASLGTLLRGAGIPGITAVSAGASGFSLHSPALGKKPIVVVAKGSRIAIGYGLASALDGLSGSGATLSTAPEYKAAVAALGKTPISAFVDGPAALRLAEAVVPHSSTEFWDAQPYLKKISYIGVGRTTGSDEGFATATLIAGLK